MVYLFGRETRITNRQRYSPPSIRRPTIRTSTVLSLLTAGYTRQTCKPQHALPSRTLVLTRDDSIAHLVGFALKLRNLGVTDHGLIRELSQPLAGSLYSGEGHSRLYDDEQVYE